MSDTEKRDIPITTCEEVLDLLHCLIHNELEDHEAEAVLTHLATCRTCRHALAEHVKLAGLLTTNMPWIGKIYFSTHRASYH